MVLALKDTLGMWSLICVRFKGQREISRHQGSGVPWRGVGLFMEEEACSLRGKSGLFTPRLSFVSESCRLLIL